MNALNLFPQGTQFVDPRTGMLTGAAVNALAELQRRIGGGLGTIPSGQILTANGAAPPTFQAPAIQVPTTVSGGTAGQVLESNGPLPAVAAWASGANSINFSAFQTSAQSIPSSAITALLLTSVAFQNGGFYIAASAAFQPPAGLYLVFGGVNLVLSAAAPNMIAIILKNSAQERNGGRGTLLAGMTGGPTNLAVALLQMNGTDFVQLAVYQDSGAVATASPGIAATYFQGFRLL